TTRHGRVRLWDVATGRFVRDLTGHGARVNGLAVSPDGRLLATAGADKAVRLWALPSGEAVGAWTAHANEAEAVAFSPDGRLLASAGRDGAVRVWDLERGAERHALAERGDDGRGAEFRNLLHRDGKSIAFSPDGRRLAAGTWRAVQVWDVATG